MISDLFGIAFAFFLMSLIFFANKNISKDISRFRNPYTEIDINYRANYLAPKLAKHKLIKSLSPAVLCSLRGLGYIFSIQ